MKNQHFMRFPDFKRKALTLSYDDGVVYDRRLIEIMDRYGLKGTFNINSGLFAEQEGGRRLTEKEAVELYGNSPHEIAVHGYEHFSLSTVDGALATNDVLEDRKNLERIFGRVVRGMAYANGRYDDNVVEILKACGIKYARTTVATGNFNIPTDWLRLPATCHHNDPRLMELAKRFVEEKEYSYYWSNYCKLFYLWGHSFEFNDQDNWHIIEEFAKYVGGKEDIWYATNGEIYDYIEAFDRLVFSAQGDRVYNPTCTVLYMDYFGKQYVVAPGESIELKK